jgi:hypothetical protein
MTVAARLTERSDQLALAAVRDEVAGRIQPGAALVDLGYAAGQDLHLLTPAFPRLRTIQLAAPTGFDLTARKGRLAQLNPETDVLAGPAGRTGWPQALLPHVRRQQRIVHVGASGLWWLPVAPRRAFLSRLRRELRGDDLALIAFTALRDAAVLEQVWQAGAPGLVAAIGRGGVVRSHFDPSSASMVTLRQGSSGRWREAARLLVVRAGEAAARSRLALPAPLELTGLTLAADGAAGYLVVEATGPLPDQTLAS